MGMLDRVRPSTRQVIETTSQLVSGDTRDPRAATINNTWRSTRYGMESQWSADDAIRWAYYANTYVYACVRAIAQDIAALPFRAGPKLSDQTSFQESAPLAVLLGPPPGGPTSNLSAKRLWAWTITQYIVTGRWAWEIETAAGPNPQVVGLWPLIVGKLKPIPTAGGASWWSGFEYSPTGQRIFLRPDQVLYDWRPSQTDFREPESVLQAARLDISVAVMQDRYDYAFLQNDARPAAVVVHDSFEEEGQKLAWRRQFEDRHRGPDNAGKVAWAENTNPAASPKDAIFIQSLGLTQADAEFIARYEMKIRAICVALGVPLSRLGDSSKRTFSNADRETINYWRNTVWPIMSEIQDSINMQLAPRVGRQVGWFETCDVEALRKAPRWVPADGQAMVAAGQITLNEHRQELGLPPVDGGDELKEPAPPPALPAAAPGDPAADPAVIDTTGTEATAGRVVALRQVRAARGEPDELERALQRRSRLWHQTNRAVESLENQWTRKIQRLFNDQRDSVIARLEGKRGRQGLRAANPDDISHAYDRVYWDQRVKDLTVDLYEQVMTAAGVAMSAAFDIDFDVDAPYAQEFILGRANKLAGQINDTTYDGIKEQLSEGAAQGDSIPNLAKRIRTLFDQTYKHRAETVARTEVTSGYNGSAYTVANESDSVTGLEWIATRDKRTRKSHRAMDGQQIQKGQFFQLDGATIAYPGDPNVQTQMNSEGVVPNPAEFIVNCRCTLVPIVIQTADAAPRGVPAEVVRQAVLGLAMGRLRLEDALAGLAS